jgi:DNA invertase Pin-like site-specific DNA recombinase
MVRKPKIDTEDPSVLRRSAQYVRMSSEHQQYSIANQSAAIALYAAAHNLGVVRAFVDGGKTGTTIKRRTGLQELLRIVESGTADFDEVLVYDVSRWGRFPDNDEGAHYEYLCKKAGIKVRYCAEQFENDNSTTSNLLKALKRTMAAEYSRELSVKVHAGQKRLASMGFWQGGNAPFGMARQVIDQAGRPKGILRAGEWKSISTDRVVLLPGRPEEVQTVRLAFDLYTKKGKSRHQIVQILNQRKVFRGSTPWTITKVRLLLIDLIYKGAYAYCRHDQKSDTWQNLPRHEWLVREHAFPGIISDEQWTEAGDRVREEVKLPGEPEMLEGLRRLWKRKGRLNSNLINAAKDLPSVVAYSRHFGGINEAYKLVGYPLPKDYSFVEAIRMSRGLRSSTCDDICKGVRAIGGTAENLPIGGMLLLNQNVTIKVCVIKGWVRPKLKTVWRLLLGRQSAADVVIIARLKPPISTILDFFVIPACSQLRGVLTAQEQDNDAFLDIYRFDTLQPFIDSFRRCSVRMSP